MAVPPKERYRFRYISDENYLDIDTLLTSQMEFKQMLEEVKKDIYREGRLRIRAGPITHGSFELELLLDLVTEGLPLAPLVLAPESIAAIRRILDFLCSYLGLKKLLKGKKPDKVETKGNEVSIQSGSNVTVVEQNVYNTYIQNVNLDSAARRNFAALEQDPDVAGLEVLREKEPILTLERSDFEAISAPNECLEEEVKEQVVDGDIVITKAILDPDRKWKWGFVYQGRRINAEVTDGVFNQKVKNGLIEFAHGDALKARLKIVKKYDPALRTFVETEIVVLEVMKIMKSGQQTKLDTS